MSADTDAGPMIEIADLWKSFGAVEVLKGVSLRVGRGGVIAIIGPSGSGKSTLLRCVNLLEEPDRGQIRVGGREMKFGERRRSRTSDRELAAFRAATGMVFQHFNLFPHMTALENVTAGPIIVRRMSRRMAEAEGRELLAKVGLADKAEAYPTHLSGGQRQRVAIARALAMGPAVMLLDEVTSALDPELVGEVINVLEKLATDGMTMILVTHEMGFARVAADTIVFMHQGQIWEKGPPSRLFNAPATAELASFIDAILPVSPEVTHPVG